MRAALFHEVNKPLVLRDLQLKPKKGQVRVSLNHAALNHRDVWIMKGLYPNLSPDVVLGSDGCGTYQGRRILINPGFGWKRGVAGPPADFHILGMPSHGTFAEEVFVDPYYIHEVPDHLSNAEAAALPLGGVTAYRTLFTRCSLRKTDTVLINGIGGGVAQFAFLFATAIGCQVYVTSSDNQKLNRAEELGAVGGANYKDSDWSKQLKAQAGGFDVIVDSAGGDATQSLLGICNQGARIGMYGGTLGKMNNLSPQVIFWKQISILGTSMGNAVEFKKMLDLVSTYKIKPTVDRIFTLSTINEALQYLESGKHFGKVVISVEE